MAATSVREATEHLFRQIRSVIFNAVVHLSADDGFAMASHVALSALMAVFPFLIFVAALAGFFGESGLAERVATILFDTWPKDVAGPIAADVRSVLTQQQTGLLTISALVMIYLASNGVEAVRTALNRAYRVTDTRNFFFLRLQSFLFVVAGAAASLIFALLGVLGPVLFSWVASYIPAIEAYSAIFDFVRFAVTGLMLSAVLVAAHLWLPAGRPPLVRLWPGIVTTLALWLLAAWAFGFYLQRFANYAAYYAGLASVVTAIFFMYLVALIMIFGAELNATLARIAPGSD
jgi:membrane protein